MTESNHPTPPIPLSPSGRRAVAALVLGTATSLPPFAASLALDILDSASWAVLASAGASPAEARHILSVLWVEPTGGITEWDDAS